MAYKGGPHIIVLGNEKGGSGKSTTAMHVIVALMKEGRRVAAIDLDGRQKSLGRYIENRQAFSNRKGLPLDHPAHAVITRSNLPVVVDAEAAESVAFFAALDGFAAAHDVVVIDCPGNDSFLARLGHAHADTLITPLNDSFIDFDLLARVDPDKMTVLGPSLYAEMVWDARKKRAIGDRGKIDWVVLRNRLPATEARNKRRVGQVLEDLSKRIGFRVAPGFGERVIYRELFLNGLTLMDLKESDTGISLTLSHVAARTEVRALIAALNLPALG